MEWSYTSLTKKQCRTWLINLLTISLHLWNVLARRTKPACVLCFTLLLRRNDSTLARQKNATRTCDLQIGRSQSWSGCEASGRCPARALAPANQEIAVRFIALPQSRMTCTVTDPEKVDSKGGVILGNVLCSQSAGTSEEENS